MVELHRKLDKATNQELLIEEMMKVKQSLWTLIFQELPKALDDIEFILSYQKIALEAID